MLLFLPVFLVSQVTQETRAELPDWSQPLFQIWALGGRAGARLSQACAEVCER